MDKHTIKIRLRESHRELTEYILDLTDEEFSHQPEGKWTSGQQMEHIYRSVKPLVKVMGLPKPTLLEMFGTMERKHYGYDELVARYKARLAGGVKASDKFSPGEVSLVEKETIAEALANAINHLSDLIDTFTEQELDEYCILHPALGKLSVREMLWFTEYHAQHHLINAKTNLAMK